jgi:hypothetical protein
LTPTARRETIRASFAAMPSLAKLTLQAGLCLLFAAGARADDEALALAIVYDTSGSMAELVQRPGAAAEPKFQIGNRALAAIVTRLEKFRAETGRPLQTGLFVFSKDGGREVVKLGPFDPAALRRWLENFRTPNGGTPLGGALRDATQALWKTKAGSRHVLIITDGENSVGPKPADLIPGLQEQCLKNGLSVYFHFVAFDVDARAFDAVKKFGSTLLGANDEAQLNQQLSFVLEEKILLEKE